MNELLNYDSGILKPTRIKLTITKTLLLLFVANLALLFKLSWLSLILWPIFLITPGLLIIHFFKLKGRLLKSLIAFGLSLTFLIVVGLITDASLLLGVSRPLSQLHVVLVFDIFYSFLLLIYSKTRGPIQLKIGKPKIGSIFTILFGIIILALIIGGSIRLNNGGTNIYTVVAYILLAVYTIGVYIAVSYRKLQRNALPFIIGLIAVILILSGWLRSWHVSGSDINAEFEVFKLTLQNHRWDISLYRNAYNACLSISLLPVIISKFVLLRPELIFKIVMPLIGSVTPIVVYLISRKFVVEKFAFLAAVFYMAQPAFNVWLSVPVRQSIALVFFSLAILMIVNTSLQKRNQRLLFLILNLGMVVSHYSTAYLAILLYILLFILSKVHAPRSRRKFITVPSLTLLCSITLFTFLWFSQITVGFNGLTGFLATSVKNVGQLFSDNVQVQGQSPINQFNVFSSFQPTNLFQNYEKANQAFSIEPITVVYPQRTSGDVVQKVDIVREALKDAGKLLVIWGVIPIVVLLFKRKIVHNDKLLALAAIITLGLFLILPFVSIAYDQERGYQQALIILAPVAIIGGLKFTRQKILAESLFAVFIASYLIFLSGFVYQFTLGGSQSMVFNNSGQMYDMYYVQNAELDGAQWLLSHQVKDSSISADNYAMNRIRDAEHNGILHINNNILPGHIPNGSYVYLDNFNVKNNAFFAPYLGQVVVYRLPSNYLNSQDLVYANQKTEIYK